jgi:hypothetical protein
VGLELSSWTAQRENARSAAARSFTSRHPILTVGMTLERSGVERGDRIRYERAWVCQNGRRDYRELVGEA